MKEESFFQFKSFKIKQPEKGLKVTSEACLLGAIASHPNPQNLIDIGCGTGILSMMIAQRFPSINITAIDIDDNIIENAQYNLSNLPFNNHYELINRNFLDIEFENSYDLLICNPPFYNNHLKSPYSYKNTYLHIDTLPFNLLISKSISIMNSQSLFWILLPPYQMSLFANICKENGLNLSKKINVFRNIDKPFRLIYCFTKEKTFNETEETLILFDNNNKITPEYRTLMKDYYLNL